MRPLTTADVARRPLPGTTTPTGIAFSPDGSTVTCLLAEPGSLRQSLVAVDVATGTVRTLPTPGTEVDEADLGLEERLRRERARELAVGVTRHAWAADAPVVLVPMGDGLWILEGVSGLGDPAARRVVAADDLPGPALDAAICADGSTVSFVCDDEVHVVAAAGGPVRRVTTGARGTGRTNGLAEYVAQEEMLRATGHWLSPDGRRLAFAEVDETHVPVYRIVHQGSDEVGEGAQEDHRYPFAGAANARVRLGVVDVPEAGAPLGEPTWIDLGATGIGDDRYLARVTWADPDRVLVQVEDRAQARLDLLGVDLPPGPTGTGAPGVSLLVSEASDVWINLHDDLRPLPDGGFLWSTERSGFRHLERRAADGSLVRTLTAGDWLVTGVAGIDPEAAVWAVTTEGSARTRRLVRVPLDGSPATRVDDPGPGGDGMLTAVVHGPSGAWVGTASSPTTPPVTTLHRPGGAGVVLHDAATDPVVAELSLPAPEPRTVVAGDDVTELHAAVYRPGGAGPHPLVVWCYGGPHAQLVTDGWGPTVALRAQLLAQRGFCVAVVDNRGMAARGLAFEGALRHRMGTVEVDDQVRLVEALVAEGLADPERVGIYGWSYGGYLSAMCLARRPDVFRAACAGAPVTSWDGYDTHYTERYMGTPASNPEGYAAGSVMTHVEGVRDRHLLLVHGLIDENVHFRHTARLLNALLRADLPHELLLYPDERHVPRHEADRASMESRILDFFTRTLGAA